MMNLEILDPKASGLEILDPTWIATILSISFTLVVFLLGLPMIFIQTFIPEELRKFYRDLQKKDNRKINLSAVLLLFIILIFGNHGFKYFIEYDLPDKISIPVKLIPTIDKNTQLIIYYFSSLGIFLLLSYRVFVTFKREVFREYNFKKEIIKTFFERLTSSFIVSKKLNEQDFSDLIELSKVFNDGLDGFFFHEELFEFIFIIIDDKKYRGEGTKIIFEEILYLNFIKTPDFKDYKSIENLLSLCKDIANKYNSAVGFQSFDSEYITQIFIYQLCVKFIRTDNINLANKCITILDIFNTQQSIYFKIYFAAFEQSLYRMIVTEINKITKLFVYGEPNANDRAPMLNNLIAYLAFFYSGNPEMKHFVNESAHRLGQIFNKDACIAAKTDLNANAKFDTAHKIEELTNDYFGTEKTDPQLIATPRHRQSRQKK